MTIREIKPTTKVRLLETVIRNGKMPSQYDHTEALNILKGNQLRHLMLQIQDETNGASAFDDFEDVEYYAEQFDVAIKKMIQVFQSLQSKDELVLLFDETSFDRSKTTMLELEAPSFLVEVNELPSLGVSEPSRVTASAVESL